MTGTNDVKSSLESFVSHQTVNTAPSEIIIALITVCYRSAIHVFRVGVNSQFTRKAQWDSLDADTSMLINFGRPVFVKLSRSEEAGDVSDSGVVNVDADVRLIGVRA